jgi:putative FmdB family regulatory protein
MPIYEYVCDKCGEKLTVLSSIEKRDEVYSHESQEPGADCSGQLQRQKFAQVTVGKPSYQMGAVMSDGSIVRGHFGKDANRGGKGWHRP